MARKLVLVADDLEDHREVFAATLAHFGYGVVMAANGAEAVEQARQHRPDLILMDLNMPVLNGWSAMEVLRADPDTASIPVTAITIQDHGTEALQAAGFCAYVKKPVLANDLLSAVQLCLDSHARKKSWIDIPTFRPPSPLGFK